jgi:hypothetical protein
LTLDYNPGSAGNGEFMRQGTGISASVGAILGSLATMVCCLPLAFAAAIGAAGASAFLLRFRPWFLGLSIVLVGFGFWQQRRARQCEVKGRIVGQVLLWTAVIVVVGTILFPQQIAGFIADRLSGP